MNPLHWARATSLCLALFAAHPASAQTPASPAPATEKVLRYSFPVAETGFDPPQLSDLYSRTVAANIFEGLYRYDFLARPAKVKPALAEALPEITPDFKSYTVRLKRGVYFSSDPAFGGKRREVTAQDIAYVFKRHFDPKTKSPTLSSLQEDQILGLAELRQQAEKTGKFDYDTPVEGLNVIDRYTIQFKLGVPRPRFIYQLSDASILPAMAREVVEKYGDKIMEHPVGTGPFKLSEWRRSSKITLVRNPDYREVLYDEEAPANDPQAQAIAAKLKGRRLPLVDKVVVTIIDEQQPRWLSFLNNEQDFMERLQEQYAQQAVPNGKLAPNLAKRGIQIEQSPLSDFTMFYFNMTHPVVGGYTPEKVALRRAIGLAFSAADEIRLSRRGQAIAAHAHIMPNTASYRPDFRSEMGQHDKARAIALLDMYGYTDKNGDGWRDLPDGKPLVLDYDTLSSGDYRERDEIMKKNFDAVGVKINYRIGKWPEQLRASRTGKLMMWGYGYSATSPNSSPALQLGYSKSIGQQNHSRFKSERFDELYERQNVMPDGPERDALLYEASKIMTAYMPIKLRVHRLGTDAMQPWLYGFKRHPFMRDFWSYVDIETEKLPKK